MKRLRGCLLACAALVKSLLAPGIQPSSATGRSESTHSYGTHPRRKLDAYWTTSNSSQPRIIILHGGYEYEGSEVATRSRHFADRGYAAFSVDYRLNLDVSWAAPRTDPISAIDRIRDNVAKFDLDPERLGSSAGAQIATALAAYGAGANRVGGVVALAPTTSPYRAWDDRNHDTSTDKQRKIRNNATILARFPYPADTDTSLHASCWGTWTDFVVKNRASGVDDAPVQLSLDLEEAEEVGHGMHTDGVTVETAARSSAHGSALLDIPGMPEKVLARIGTHV
ncbi:alpha/beta hydrolase [Streptomyces sp. NPDC050264]|uniref:alpha/beta hydrolase n=1 Tax=Streptomyces sp. NPDC050264 TaxID=3155038 RepID=UPI00342CA38E